MLKAIHAQESRDAADRKALEWIVGADLLPMNVREGDIARM